MMNCKQATYLMSQSQDRQLSRWQNIALRMHLLICTGCNNFNRQLDFIRDACRRIGGNQER